MPSWAVKLVASRTLFQCCYKFSRCTSKAASPTNGDGKALNKLARQLKAQPVKLQFWPLTRPLRIIRFRDASYRNNEDGSSQQGMTVFQAESRERTSKAGMSHGSPIDKKKSKDQEDCAFHYGGGIVFFHEMFWFMPVSHIWLS